MLPNQTQQPRILFVTIGQSPRPDLLQELTQGLGIPAKISEMGLLDGLGATEIDEFRSAHGNDSTVIASLANGAWISLSQKNIGRRAIEKIASVPQGDYDLIVLMSTGIFRDLESTCATVNVQRALDAAVISVAAQGDKIGIIVPLERQIHELEIPALALFETRLSYAGHSDYEQLRRAAHELDDCAYIVLNSAGYGEAHRAIVAELTGKPVILPRRIIISSIRLILSSMVAAPIVGFKGNLQARLDTLTARERQVMSLVCEGQSNKAIARQLSISHKTVEIHRSNVLRKMDVPSSGALIRMMVRAGVA